MGALNTNPENGRRSGDVWSVLVASGVAVQKGDMIALTDTGYGVPIGTATTDATTFLGIADEKKDADGERSVIVLSKGVFPLNKASATVLTQGDALTFSDANTLAASAAATDIVAGCFKSAGDGETTVLAKIHSNI